MGCWCTTNEKDKTKAIADATSHIGTLNADMEKHLAEFTEEEKDMMNSISSLGSAVTTLSKHNSGALLQLSDGEQIDVMTTITRVLKKHKDLLSEVVTPR